MRFEYYSTSEKEVVLHLAEPYRLVGDHIGDAFILIEAEKIISQFREKAGVSFGSLSDTGIPVSCDQDWEENGGRMCAKLPPLENKNSKITGVKLTPNQVIFSGEFPDKVIGEIINLLKNFNLSANKETKKMRITLDQGLLRLQPQIGLGVIISRITNSSSQSEAGNEVWKELNGVCERIKQKISAEEMGEIPEITGGRKCFKSLGVSSQYLVSSEALLKRVISGNSLYRINTTVEVNNLCSIRCYRSLGSYDLSGIQGDVIFRQGVAEDNYTGTNKRTIYLKNIPLLADAKGPFGNPYSHTPTTHFEKKLIKKKKTIRTDIKNDFSNGV